MGTKTDTAYTTDPNLVRLTEAAYRNLVARSTRSNPGTYHAAHPDTRITVCGITNTVATRANPNNQPMEDIIGCRKCRAIITRRPFRKDK